MKVINRYGLREVKFPVYKMPPHDYEIKDGIVWAWDGKIIDDTNQEGKTLGMRRLQTPHPVKPIRCSYNNIAAFLRQSRNEPHIDSSGFIFKYRKEQNERLISHKIKSIKLRETHCVVTLWGVNFPIKLKEPPSVGAVYANVLYLGDYPWVIYSYSDEPIEATHRKV